jgi:dimethylargininase
MLTAITRDVSASLADCQLSFVSRDAIDIALAKLQHEAYRKALESLGCKVIALPAQDALPDAVFVEDVAIVLDEIAIVTRPGAPSRREEGASVADVLRNHRQLRTIEAPATIDGGDVLLIGRRIYVGQGDRSNPEGIAQLEALVAEFGYTIRGIPTCDCLHLKSAVTQVGEDTLLIQPDWVDRDFFDDFRLIEVDPGEEHAANALRVGTGVIHPACFPLTQARLRDAGIVVVPVDLSELQKAEGATTCCSLVFRDLAPA